MEKGRFVNFDGNDRLAYPEGYYRVTGGEGGEAILFFLDDTAILYDCGMAYCHQRLLENIEMALTERGKKGIDYILLSHTHYDHIGALPYVLEKYPKALVYGAAKCEKVFKSKAALDTMVHLGSIAMKDNHMDVDISNTAFRIDRTLTDGEEIIIGDHIIIAYETLGHTDCSMSYYIKKDKFLFSSESTGVLENKEYISPSILKNYQQTIDSAHKLAKLNIKTLYSPHYGIVPRTFIYDYFDLYIRCANEIRDFILARRKEGKNEEQILDEYVEKFYNANQLDHPKEAFTLNAMYAIKNIK